MVGSWYERKRPRTSQPSETFRFPDLNASSLAPLCSLNRELLNNTRDTVALWVINCKELLGTQRFRHFLGRSLKRKRSRRPPGSMRKIQLHFPKSATKLHSDAYKTILIVLACPAV